MELRRLIITTYWKAVEGERRRSKLIRPGPVDEDMNPKLGVTIV